MNKKAIFFAALLPVLGLLSATARADEWSDTETLFKNAGESGHFFSSAYGYAMSSHFLNRPRPAEVVLDGAEVHLTTRRETFEDLIATQLSA